MLCLLLLDSRLRRSFLSSASDSASMGRYRWISIDDGIASMADCNCAATKCLKHFGIVRMFQFGRRVKWNHPELALLFNQNPSVQYGVLCHVVSLGGSQHCPLVFSCMPYENMVILLGLEQRHWIRKVVQRFVSIVYFQHRCSILSSAQCIYVSYISLNFMD